MSPFDPRVILRPILLALPVVFASILTGKENPPPPPPPIRALLVTGGCSHEYPIRQEILTRGIRERVVRPIEWVVRLQGAGEGDARIPLFESPDWAKDYDIVVHDHCFPRVTDPTYVDRVLAPHRAGLPAVLLHGTMMSFRTGDQRWFDFTGLTTRAHERERAIRVEALAPADPVLKGFAPWEIPREELYRVETAKSGIVALTRSLDPAGLAHVTSWTHHYGPARARVFGTTLGNATATLADARYLDLVARGFLWSLGSGEESAFRVVPPDQSLKGFLVPPPAKPFLRPGTNARPRGVADGFQWGQEGAASGAGLAVDGDLATAWRPGGKGPGWWSLRFARPEELSIVAVWWEGEAPAEAGLEGTSDGRSWEPLARLPTPRSPDDPILVRFEARPLSALRLNVPRTGSGQSFAIRELAAYASEEDLPSAILAAVPDPPDLIRFRSAGEGERATVRLAPGWSLVSLESIALRGSPRQLLATTGGEVFVTTFPENGERGEVLRFQARGSREKVPTVFLSGIAPQTRVAWDGEWLYTLSGPRLERVRRALGEGPANERQKFDDLFHLPGEGAASGLVWTDFHLADDGWLNASYLTKRAGTILLADQSRIPLAREGSVRFRRDGSGFSLGDDPPARDPLAGVAEIEGVALVARMDSRLWFLQSGGETGPRLGCLSDGTEKPSSPAALDDLPTEELSGAFATAGGEGIRRDLAWEMARRKRPPLAKIGRLLGAKPRAGDASPLVAVLAAQPGREGQSTLLSLTVEGKDPPVRAAAFRALGDFRGSLDPGVFRDLGSVTEPSVTAAIFDGMRRRGVTLPGAERIALRLSHHPDTVMAAAAFAFLKNGGAPSVAFAAFSALDTDERRKDWPRAFALLATHPDPDIVVGIMERLSTTRDPALRRGLLETLCRLRTTPSGETWSETAAIDATLVRALSDSRVDRVALLEAMEQARVPLDDPALLLRLGRENSGLEAYAIGRLLDSKHPLPEGAIEWLEIVSADPARDEALRRSAQALQSGDTGKDRSGPSSAPAPLPPLTDGRLLFRSLGCAGCHNLDGEGFAVGPDLVAVLSGLGASEAKDRLAHPSGPAPVRLETSAGRILSGWIVEEQANRLILLDFAGNRFELDSGTITQRNPAPAEASPCRATAELEAASFADLLEFLRSLSAP